MRIAPLVIAASFLMPLLGAMPPASAAGLIYYPDPAYKRLNDDDPQPMEEMLELAKEGDPRAQFILGDMYQKGKGGLAKDMKESRRWFEEAAMHGHGHSFIRLAAQAKHAHNPVEAWQWYTLAIDALDSGPDQDYAIAARKELAEQDKLSRDDIDTARKAISAWEDSRDKRLREERDEARNAQTTTDTVKQEQPEEKNNESH